MEKKWLVIDIIYILIASILMSIVDGIIKPSYLIKSSIKIVIFLFIPVIFLRLKNVRFVKPKLKKDLAYFLIIGLAFYLVIIGGYFLLNNIIDFTNITKTLSESGINQNNFMFVFFYIPLINAPIEEFFFRGYQFQFQTNKKKFFFVLSALLFSIYHTGMLDGFFNIYIYLFSIVGLFVVGFILNLINWKYKSIFPSLILHIFLNLGLNTVALILFGII